MTGDEYDGTFRAREAVGDARREAAAAMARLAEVAVRYADRRIAEDTAAGVGSGSGKHTRTKPGEFVADELALMLRDQPYPPLPTHRRTTTHRTRRLSSSSGSQLRFKP